MKATQVLDGEWEISPDRPVREAPRARISPYYGTLQGPCGQKTRFGRAIALRFRLEGATVLINGRRLAPFKPVAEVIKTCGRGPNRRPLAGSLTGGRR